MALRRGRSSAPSQGGFALIEVVVSALIAVIVTGGVISLLNVTGRAGAEERHRSQAYSVAQEDQARMRGMQIPSLNGYTRTETVSVGGTPYTVVSRGSFINDKTASLSCSEGSGSADYVQISSEVTWPSRKSILPVLIESIVTPPTGSLDPTHGTLTVVAVNAKNQPISAVNISGQGPSTFTGSTDATGCDIFPDIPEGNYTVTPTFAGGFIDKDGNAPSAKTAGVVGNSTKTLRLEYDQAGSLNVGFVAKRYNGLDEASKADSIIWVNTAMTVPEHKLGSGGGTEKTSFAIPTLYPFATSQYAIYAGSCNKNNPDSEAPVASVLVPSGGPATATVKMPSLLLTVKNGSTALNGAQVKIFDDQCNVTRNYTTNSSGRLNDTGFPWSTYDICASASISGTTRKTTVSNKDVHSADGTTVALSITSSSTTGSC